LNDFSVDRVTDNSMRSCFLKHAINCFKMIDKWYDEGMIPCVRNWCLIIIVLALKWFTSFYCAKLGTSQFNSNFAYTIWKSYAYIDSNKKIFKISCCVWLCQLNFIFNILILLHFNASKWIIFSMVNNNNLF
jgi:hypothetical protein